MAVPNTFAAATSAIPLANLDANFAYYDAAYSITSTAISFTGAVTLSTGTANGVPYLNASKVLTSGAVLTFDGTILSSTRFAGALNGTVGATTANTGAFTTLTTSSTVTLNGGTANGVAYLNGSKVLTTGSALKWDLTTLTATGSGSAGEVAIRTGDTASNTSYLTFGTTNYNRAQISVSGSALTEGYMAFTTFTGGSGAEAMRLTSTGLGIGTSSPQRKFSIANGGPVVEIDPAGIGSANPIYFNYNRTTSVYTTPQYWALAHNWMVSGGTSAMLLDSSGNLGIGTSSPDAKLVVSGASGTYAKITDGTVITFLQARSADSQGVVGTLSNHALGFWTNSASRMLLDSSGNLGLGVTPSAWASPGRINLPNAGAVVAQGATLDIGANWYFNSGFKYATAAAAAWYQQDSGTHRWYRSTSTPVINNDPVFDQAMMLDASGNLLVGQTSGSDRLAVTQNGSNDVIRANLGTSGSGLTVVGSGSTMTVGFFVTSSGGAGSITCSGTTTLYNITSDQRLKENIQDAAPASALIDSLQVRQYDWKSDGSHQRYGFVAQELVAVAPEAVHQPENPEEMMAVDYSKLVPMLVKEIQDLRKRLATLEAK